MRTVVVSLALLFALTSAVALADSTPIPESSHTDFGYATPDAALAALRGKPGVTIREENDWFVVTDTAEHTYWSITTPRNPVHPSGVKRTLVERDGAIHMVMSVKCGSSKENCDEMVRQFRELNAQLEEAIRQDKAK